MQINPCDFIVTEAEIRNRLKLSPQDTTFPYGYEDNFELGNRRKIAGCHDLTTLLIRLRPDFYIQKNGFGMLVEAKKKIGCIEAAQLYLNQQLSKIGIRVFYSFPDKLVPADKIPLQRIFVPPRYRDVFDSQLKQRMLNDNPKLELIYCGQTNGSGDPYVVYNGVNY